VVVLLVLACWVAAELFVAIKVADAIGVLLTVVLLFAGWPVGTWVLRSRGRAAWRRLSIAVSEGRAPGREVIDGALVLFAGALLMVPGFITDVLGICALLPPTRTLARWLLVRNLYSRVVVGAARFGAGRYDVDSTARDVDQPQLPR
jgi:UPF0716 protein FxsA